MLISAMKLIAVPACPISATAIFFSQKHPVAAGLDACWRLGAVCWSLGRDKIHGRSVCVSYTASGSSYVFASAATGVVRCGAVVDPVRQTFQRVCSAHCGPARWVVWGLGAGNSRLHDWAWTYAIDAVRSSTHSARTLGTNRRGARLTTMRPEVRSLSLSALQIASMLLSYRAANARPLFRTSSTIESFFIVVTSKFFG